MNSNRDFNPDKGKKRRIPPAINFAEFDDGCKRRVSVGVENMNPNQVYSMHNQKKPISSPTMADISHNQMQTNRKTSDAASNRIPLSPLSSCNETILKTTTSVKHVETGQKENSLSHRNVTPSASNRIPLSRLSQRSDIILSTPSSVNYDAASQKQNNPMDRNMSPSGRILHNINLQGLPPISIKFSFF